MADPPYAYAFAGLLDDLLGTEAAPSSGGAPVRVARVRHEGRPWLVHEVVVPVGVACGDRVIFEVPEDSAFGEVLEEPRIVAAPGRALPMATALPAGEVEKTAERVAKREAEAFAFFRERVAALRLPMKLVHVELSAVHGKLAFYFACEHRVDFRDLVADLRRRFHLRIELQQMGTHEAARQVGAIGRCGRELCSRTWQAEYPPVSIKHARTQGLSPIPGKLAGSCGKLMGCLDYEQAQYAEARKGLPREGKRVDTPIGPAVVKELDILHHRVKVKTEDGQWATFPVEELRRPGDAASEGEHEGEPGEEEISAPPPAPEPTAEARPALPPLPEEREPGPEGEASGEDAERRKRRRRRRTGAPGEAPAGGGEAPSGGGEPPAERASEGAPEGAGPRRRRGRRRPPGPGPESP